MSIIPARVRFEEAGSRLTAVEIVRGSRSPVIASLHRAMIALGIVVSSYEAHAGDTELMERIVLERGDGGCIEAQLTDVTKAAIMAIAMPEYVAPSASEVSAPVALLAASHCVDPSDGVSSSGASVALVGLASRWWA